MMKKSSKKRIIIKITSLRPGHFAVVSHPSANSTRTGLTLVDAIASICT